MKKITSSIYTFEDLIADGFLYIDKTEYIWKLVSRGIGHYFLARPRRFGKSLTLSTLKAVFEGKKELFKGLAIYDKPYDWQPYPVIHLDLNGWDYHSAEKLRDSLCCLLKEQAETLGHTLESTIPILMFRELINLCSEQRPVVILIDEYDKPILNNIGTPHAQEILRILKSFYSVIKALQHKIRFTFVTGVSKFSHVSMFSDLNNLIDISMTPDYATLLGYTQQELETAFAEHLEHAAQAKACTHKQLLEDLKKWYNGYRFEKNAQTVYNPVSIACFFIDGAEFNNYWYTTGTPTFLLELIKQQHFHLESAFETMIAAEAFGTFEISDLSPLPLLFQTGYLTIKKSEVIDGETMYHLDFPNREVGLSFSKHLLRSSSCISSDKGTNFILSLAKAMRTCDTDLLRLTLETFFACIPYDLHHKNEANFHNIFFAIFRLLGYRITAESRTSHGRIDAVCETDSCLFLFEFKLNNDKRALEQIYRNEYFAPYLLHGKRIMLIGATFDTREGKLHQWQCEEYPTTTHEENSIC